MERLVASLQAIWPDDENVEKPLVFICFWTLGRSWRPLVFVFEGFVEGVVEGFGECVVEGFVEGGFEGFVEGVIEGVVKGFVEGLVEGFVFLVSNSHCKAWLRQRKR